MLLVAEVLRDRQRGQRHPPSRARRLDHLSIDKHRTREHARALHVGQEFMALARALADPGKDGDALVLLNHGVDELHQPTLATEVASLQERIASIAGAAVTAIQAVYVPADDFTDPAVTAISSHMDSIIMLSRTLAAEGFYPAIDPLASSSMLLDPLVVGEEHYRIAERAREALARFKDLQDIIALLGVEELGASDRLIVKRARRLQRFLSQPFSVTEAFTGTPGRSVRRADTLAGCRAILDGEADNWAESSLYMIGTLNDARQKEAASAETEGLS